VITSFYELKQAIGNWLNRADLADRIPEFIQLAEARFRRKLADVEQQAITTLALTGGAATLPADFASAISISDTATSVRLEQVSASQFYAYDQSDSGSPVVFTIIGDQIKVLPANDTTLELVYRQSIPALSDSTTTNWLLTRAPDAYLFGALIQAEFFGWNDDRLPLIKSALDEMIAELCVDSERRNYGPAPLAPRISRT
jgi:hypothetical protein